jgi:very-short-patch-repair endonuclease
LTTKDEPAGGPVVLPFKLRDDFLSNAETSFCQVLRAVVGERAVVCPKVNLGDLFFVAKGDHRKNRALENRIDRKHVDFLLCEPKTMRPIVGLELDDKSHNRPGRQTRDQLVKNVFSAAGLPLVRFAVRSGYAPSEVEAQIGTYLAEPIATTVTPVKPPKSPEAATASADSSPDCPKCGSKMVLRTAKSGANSGGKFWGCSNFPRCRSILTVR